MKNNNNDNIFVNVYKDITNRTGERFSKITAVVTHTELTSYNSLCEQYSFLSEGMAIKFADDINSCNN